MTWLEHHKISEDYACDADTARWRGDLDVALAAYAAAGRWEEKALAQLDASDEPTHRIIAVSAVALFYKAKAYSEALRLGQAVLEQKNVAESTKAEIKEILAEVDQTKNKPRSAAIGTTLQELFIHVVSASIMTCLVFLIKINWAIRDHTPFNRRATGG